jgi:uncharacterized zinc-type alcohol dehydrogenase-like protein
MEVKAYAAQNETSPLQPHIINRREPREHDVQIDILYCGICHSDLHTARGEWGGTMYPCVPGHEIVGRVVKVGSHVKKYAEGDIVGVGCMVDSCQECSSCKEGLEQYCENGFVGTYNGQERDGSGYTFGGYSKQVVVHEDFVLKIRDTENLAGVAPLLCAGITTYSPLRHWGVKKGDKVGVVGLGGLGHMAVKLAASFGADVTMISHSPSKQQDAEKLGAHHFLLTKDADQVSQATGRFDFILDTVSADHDYNMYMGMLKRDGKMVCVGAPASPAQVPAFTLIMGRKTLAGSLIGGIPETQEMLDYCAEHKITSDVEVININYINEAYERMLKGDVRYRFVIDMSTL